MKKGMKLIPFFILSIFITVFAIASVFVLIRTAMGEEDIFPKAEIAIVAGSDGSDNTVEKVGKVDFKTMMMIGIIENMDSVRSICRISYKSPKEAWEGLVNGSISAAVYLPEGVYENIDTGENTPVRIRLSGAGNAGIPGYFFRELVNSGVALIQTVETAIYSVDYLSDRYTLRGSLSEMEDNIFGVFVNAALDRGSMWKEESVSSTFGGFSLYGFYIVNVVLLTLLLFSSGFSCFYTSGENETAEVLRRLGLPRPASSGAKILAETTVFTIFSFILSIAGRILLHQQSPGAYAAFSFPGLLKGLPYMAAAAFCLAACVHLLYTFLPEKSAALLFLIITLLLFILGGGLIPPAYLPAFLRNIAPFSPIAAAQSALCGALGETASYGIPRLLIMCAVMLSAAFIKGPLSQALRIRRANVHAFGDKCAENAAAKDGSVTLREESAVTASALSASPNFSDSLFKAPGNTPVREFFLRFRIFMKQELRSPACPLLAAAGILLLLTVQGSVLPSSMQNRIGIVYSDEDISGTAARKLLQNDGAFEYVAYRNTGELKAAVSAGAVDSGFVLGAALNAAVSAAPENASGDSGIWMPDLDHCADYYFSTSTTKGEAAKEQVFTAVISCISEKIMEKAVLAGNIFEESTEETAAAVLSEMRRIENDRETFQVYFESVGESADFRRSKLWTAAALLIFAAALFFAGRRFYPEQAAVTLFLRDKGFSCSVLQVFAPLLAFGITVCAAAACMMIAAGESPCLTEAGAALPGAFGMLITAAVLFLYICACALWAVLFAKGFKSPAVCLFVSVAVILMAAVLNPGLSGGLPVRGISVLRVLVPGAWI